MDIFSCFIFYVLLVKHDILIVQACPKLIDRFKEREENVKVSLQDIYELFISFL